jgi:hypothetical protein
MRAVFQQHAHLSQLVDLGGLLGVVLRQAQEPRRAEAPLAEKRRNLLEPRPVWMVLVDGKEFRIAVHGGHQRPRVFQRVAERLLADDVNVRSLREQAVFAMKPG